MIDYTALGWNPEWVGELDHRRLKTPSLKLRSARPGAAGDVVFSVDLRVRPPNADRYLAADELHSVEHFLLEGFNRLMPEHFISVGIMGCRTGFYLIFQNEGRADFLCGVLGEILSGMLAATGVPYCNIEQCGNWRNHTLEGAQRVAREILEQRAHWLEAAA